MPATILTTEDLMEFKVELLDEIKQIISTQKGLVTKKWLKSFEVMKLLNLSPGTLQNLRINGTIPFTKIGGIILYDQDEINKLLLANRNKN